MPGQHLLIKKECAAATAACQRALLGEALAACWGVSQSSITQSKQGSGGEIGKVCNTLLKLRLNIIDRVNANDSRIALLDTLRVMGRAAGAKFCIPRKHAGTRHDLFGQASEVLGDTSRLIHDVNSAVDPDGDDGENVTYDEAQKIQLSCEQSVETLLSILDYLETLPVSAT